MTEKELSRLVVKSLGVWETTGVIVYWERLNSGRINLGNHWIKLCREGTPDFLVVFRNKEDGLHLMFLELKGAHGQLRKSQRDFMAKYAEKKDVSCHVIREQTEVSYLLNNLGIDLVAQIPEEL